MEASTRRYWAIRTHREKKPLLLGELRAGRLRQGWGYDVSQDLRLIHMEIVAGGRWWENLSEIQSQVLPHLKMLSLVDGGVQRGDLILAPNLPDDGVFLIAEVIGDYYFELLPYPSDELPMNVDYGHVLPVRLITETGINKYAKDVDARIRGTLKTPMRMWNLDGYSQEIERLVSAYRSGGDFSASQSGEARLEAAWMQALSHATEQLRQRLGSELDSRFQAAEWEEPIKLVLQNLYPSADVRWVAGAQEYGADMIVQIANYFGELPWLVIVQVKNYDGEIGPAVLQQLKTAHQRYRTEGTILSLIVMTTASTISQDTLAKSNELEKELGVPVIFILREKMMALMSSSLMSSVIGEHELTRLA